MRKGLFITFEGPDGSGKTTQIKSLASFLVDRGYDAVLTREPGGTPISEKIRDLLLDRNHQEMDNRTEALLYAASRAQHVAEVIQPALLASKTVICDRFVDSSIVYQGFGRNLGDAVRVINEFATGGITPDVTFFLKVDPKVGMERIATKAQDRLELETITYHQAVFKAYEELECRYPERIIGIDAGKTIEEISEEIQRYIVKLLPLR